MGTEASESGSGAGATISPGKVLIVDDTAIMLEMYARLLKNEGFQVRAARSGREALAAMGEQRPDVVVLDFMMPEMNGHEVLARMREDPALAAIPVILLSASEEDDAEVAARGFALGANDYLQKPVNRKLLSERVRACLAR